MKKVTIYEFQLKEILEALRITKRIRGEGEVESAYDRVVNQAYRYAENALNGDKDIRVSFGKNKV